MVLDRLNIIRAPECCDPILQVLASLKVHVGSRGRLPARVALLAPGS